jgi:GTP pyrophosphokinase
MSPERLIEVQWSGEYHDSYPASIRIKTDDRFGLLADIASMITKNNANILSAKTDTSDTGVAMFYFTIMVESSSQLRTIMSALRRVKKVTEVKRIVRYD